MKVVSVLGVDLAKSVFHLHGVDDQGRIILRRKISRSQLLKTISQLPKCLIGIEACAGSNYWAREFGQFGHRVKLMPAQYVKAYLKTNKNDFNDAEAICEAVTRPNMRFVSAKSQPQQDIQGLHRVRRRLVRNRTALSNEIRSFLYEYGIVLPLRVYKLQSLLIDVIDDVSNGLNPVMRDTVRRLHGELVAVGEEIKFYDQKIHEFFKSSDACRRISQIEGIGAVVATAIYATMSDPGSYKNGRQYAASLGLVPRQYSSGGKDKLLGISKRGDSYVRSLLIHGARGCLRWAKTKSDKKSLWAIDKINRRGYNKACVALANKNARTVWALLKKGEDYQVAI